MNKFGRRKIALALACASVFVGKTQAAQNVKTAQTLGAVVGARNQPKKINWNKIAKIGGFTVAGLAALEAIHSLIGGFTDSKFGSYSFGRLIRNHVKKNEHLDLGARDDEKLNGQDNKKIEDVNDQDIINQTQTQNNGNEVEYKGQNIKFEQEVEEKRMKNDIEQPNFFIQKVKEFNDENLEKIVDFLNNPADKLEKYVTERKCQNNDVSKFLNNYKKQINSFISNSFKIERNVSGYGIYFRIYGANSKNEFMIYEIHISSNKKISLINGFYNGDKLVFELPENVKLNVDIGEQAAPAVNNFK